MKTSTSTEALRQLMETEIYSRSKNGEYTSDTHLKRLVDKQYEAFPLFFGMNKLKNGPSNLDVIQGSRRSGLTYIRKIQDNQPIGKGVLDYMKNVKGLKYVNCPVTDEKYYFIEDELHMAQILLMNDPNYLPSYKSTFVNRANNLHETLQYELCWLGVKCGFKIHVPNSDRNRKVKNNQFISSDFAENIINDFEGKNLRSILIDCLWIDQNGKVVKAFEVENSTGVDSGMSRMSSLQNGTKCYIVGTQEVYQKKFDELSETSYKDSKMKFVYINDKLVSKEYNGLNDHSDEIDSNEAIKRIEKKFN